mmetsp:Transcript_21105/g.29026  ORF Transcript_21105/g.29026 Transcript_21105/m.29026 type:complete len:216 (-) Transcript_21105:1074-1721(-)
MLTEQQQQGLIQQTAALYGQQVWVLTELGHCEVHQFHHRRHIQLRVRVCDSRNLPFSSTARLLPRLAAALCAFGRLQHTFDARGGGAGGGQTQQALSEQLQHSLADLQGGPEVSGHDHRLPGDELQQLVIEAERLQMQSLEARHQDGPHLLVAVGLEDLAVDVQAGLEARREDLGQVGGVGYAQELQPRVLLHGPGEEVVQHFGVAAQQVVHLVH